MQYFYREVENRSSCSNGLTTDACNRQLQLPFAAQSEGLTREIDAHSEENSRDRSLASGHAPSENSQDEILRVRYSPTVKTIRRNAHNNSLARLNASVSLAVISPRNVYKSSVADAWIRSSMLPRERTV